MTRIHWRKMSLQRFTFAEWQFEIDETPKLHSRSISHGCTVHRWKTVTKSKKSWLNNFELVLHIVHPPLFRLNESLNSWIFHNIFRSPKEIRNDYDGGCCSCVLDQKIYSGNRLNGTMMISQSAVIEKGWNGA